MYRPGMKPKYLVIQFLFALIFLSQCKKYDQVYEIPDDERFIFDEGDQLAYSCSDGSTDTFLVSEVLYFDETGEDWVGGWSGSDSYKYSVENCKINLKALKDSWSMYLDLYHDYSPCYEISFPPDPNSHSVELYSFIYNGCNGDQRGDVAGGHAFDNLASIVFNNNKYYNVYYYESWGIFPDEKKGMRYEIYWNMKHGIIRFEGINEVPEIFWDLIGKI